MAELNSWTRDHRFESLCIVCTKVYSAFHPSRSVSEYQPTIDGLRMRMPVAPTQASWGPWNRDTTATGHCISRLPRSKKHKWCIFRTQIMHFSSVILRLFLNPDLKLFCTICFTEHWSDLPPAPLKLRPYGAIEVQLLLLFSVHKWCIFTTFQV